MNLVYPDSVPFENDVKVNGIQTIPLLNDHSVLFENDVKVNGIQTMDFVAMLGR